MTLGFGSSVGMVGPIYRRANEAGADIGSDGLSFTHVVQVTPRNFAFTRTTF
jgi:hypothetical protein